MRLVTWTIRIALFILLLAFAARNTEPATLRFYFDVAWQAPLVVLLLAFFAGGALLGVLAALGALLRQRREISRLRREARARPAAEPPATLPPPPAEG
jgi:lipopolysaccharide assembly protein A